MLSLIEMCSGPSHGGRVDNGIAEVTALGFDWLDANPGRWFIVGEVVPGMSSKAHTIGLSSRAVKAGGYEVETVNNRVYARSQHPSGVPLSDFVTRSYQPPRDDLPKLGRDKFDWSFSELLTAAETAREWLFPTSSHAAA
jgi:hypothetical protein